MGIRKWNNVYFVFNIVEYSTHGNILLRKVIKRSDKMTKFEEVDIHHPKKRNIPFSCFIQKYKENVSSFKRWARLGKTKDPRALLYILVFVLSSQKPQNQKVPTLTL